MEIYGTSGCPLEFKQYTQQEIMDAFWKTFYGRGEIWFGTYNAEYPFENYADAAILDYWNDFLENLEKKNND